MSKQVRENEFAAQLTCQPNCPRISICTHSNYLEPNQQCHRTEGSDVTI